jgi:hypothetical protein
MSRRILIRNATIVTMDERLGDYHRVSPKSRQQWQKLGLLGLINR